MLGTLSALTKVLAARFAVLVAVFGGIGLTFTALANPDPYRLGAIALYGLLVAIPTVWLAARG